MVFQILKKFLNKIQYESLYSESRLSERIPWVVFHTNYERISRNKPGRIPRGYSEIIIQGIFRDIKKNWMYLFKNLQSDFPEKRQIGEYLIRSWNIYGWILEILPNVWKKIFQDESLQAHKINSWEQFFRISWRNTSKINLRGIWRNVGVIRGHIVYVTGP